MSFYPRHNAARAWRLAFALLLALVGVFLFADLLGGSRGIGYRFVWAVAAGVLAVGGARFFALTDKRELVTYGLLGLIFSLSQALGYRLSIAGSIGLRGLAQCLCIGICLAPAMGCSFRWLQNKLCALGEGTPASRSPRSVFWLSFLIIIACWTPVFLAYYPGLFAYDVATQITEIVSGELTNRNPILHTLLLGGLYLLGGELGSYTLGIALYSILQALVMAAIFAWVIRYLSTLGSRALLLYLSLAFFALLPMHSILAISCTKDTLFCGILLLFAIRLHQLYREPELLRSPRYVWTTLLIAALMCLFRNNAFFGLLMCLPLGLHVVPKSLRKRLAALVLGSIVAFFGLSAGLQAAFSAKGINSTELVSLPSQQLSLVYARHRDELPASVEIEAYLPTVQDYKPHTADPVKTFAEVKRPGQLWGFIKLWGKLGLQYPLDYVEAFLLNTQGYWWLDDTSHAAIYGEGLEERQGYLLTDTKRGLDVKHHSLFPALETLLESAFSANEYQSVPVLSLLFAPALYCWLVVLLLCGAILRRQRGQALLCGFLLCYLLPLGFGPCVIIRYVYPLIVCVPLLLAPGDAAQSPKEATEVKAA